MYLSPRDEPKSMKINQLFNHHYPNLEFFRADFYQYLDDTWFSIKIFQVDKREKGIIVIFQVPLLKQLKNKNYYEKQIQQ